MSTQPQRRPVVHPRDRTPIDNKKRLLMLSTYLFIADINGVLDEYGSDEELVAIREELITISQVLAGRQYYEPRAHSKS